MYRSPQEPPREEGDNLNQKNPWAHILGDSKNKTGSREVRPLCERI